jgi:hypothetical protein
MTNLTPDETAALIHWSAYGRPGEPVTDRWIPDADERARLHPFVASSPSAAWGDVFDDAQTTALVRGFFAEVMEDKWSICSDDVSASGATSVHFHRSWTGAEIVRVDLQLTETGSRLTAARWETDPATVKTPTEQFARETFLEVCRWVLGLG